MYMENRTREVKDFALDGLPHTLLLLDIATWPPEVSILVENLSQTGLGSKQNNVFWNSDNLFFHTQKTVGCSECQWDLFPSKDTDT